MTAHTYRPDRIVKLGHETKTKGNSVMKLETETCKRTDNGIVHASDCEETSSARIVKACPYYGEPTAPTTTITETIFVSDGTYARTYTDAEASINATLRERRLREVKAYCYSGWEYSGWGSAPIGSNLEGFTGFYFTRTAQPDGFGADALIARLHSGLHAALKVEGNEN